MKRKTSIAMTEEVKAMLKQLAEKSNRSGSNMIEFLITREYENTIKKPLE